MITNQWTKSTASVGVGHCVEVQWTKSTASSANDCVEVGMKKKGESDRA